MKRFVFLLLSLSLALPCPAQKGKFDRNKIPSPVFEGNRGYVELYWKAWELAWDHVKYQPGLVQPLYMDEGLWDDTIWIWDSEFMVMYCKYAPALFPGIQTLDNFYYTMLEDCGSPLSVWHPDNPPFFAWVENDYHKFTGDDEHIRSLLTEKRFLQRYFRMFDTLTPESTFKFRISNDGVRICRKEFGYAWNCWQSGMDNTPRLRSMPMLWVDAVSQQALSALYITRLAGKYGEKSVASEFKQEYRRLKDMVNRYYWDDKDGCYYDITDPGLKTTGILTPASFWPMLAEIPSRRQAERMVDFALQDSKLGGPVPMTSVSRDDEEFCSDGRYWKGAMWLPTAYMAIKAMEKYEFFDRADAVAEKILEHMYRTYTDYAPHTIWECYSPTEYRPSIKSEGTGLVRADFCGWSALGPISLFIENVLGFYDVDAASRCVKWNLHQQCRHGIERLSFGDIVTDIIYDNGEVTVRSNKPYSLIINGRTFRVKTGESRFSKVSD